MQSNLDSLNAGDAIPALQLAPISRTTLALYAGASGDHNPMHIDIDFARNAGLDDVFAHGMLSCGYVGRLVTDWAGPERVRSLSVRFSGITHVHDQPHLSGKVVERFEQDGETRLRIEVNCANQNGEVKISGEAVVSVA
ncbi:MULTISPECIES: MaoC family dehydratase [unclassified Paraburkholderia]|uniref:MaoC family dehydratase n=1 Tax=unclassified Paraburkholderia TaxID=2615204 RepID=UPI002AB6ABB6|nr:MULTISPECIES: MaoC family dehydratase [unclassified Paraburkholderia]